MFEKIVEFIRKVYNEPEAFIPLHEPRFIGNERKYVNDCIHSTYISSVGEYVDKFEEKLVSYTNAKYAVAVVNGTAALHTALQIAGVKRNSLVITQPLTFIATCNAINYCGAKPIFIDIDTKTLGLSAVKLIEFLENNTELDNHGRCIHTKSNKIISACVPMNTYGHPVEIDRIVEICNKYNIPVVEDAAESIGSTYKGRHTGTFGLLGVYSFNGNKTITCGGGGAILTNNEKLAKFAKHLTTQAKIPHKWNFEHDEVGYNYRMPNLNAAFACAQLEQLDNFIENKRELAEEYKTFFKNSKIEFFSEPTQCRSNYWLNSIFLKNEIERDDFLKFTNEKKVMTRPAWHLMYHLKMYKNCLKSDTTNAEWVASRLVNLPSSVRK